MLKPLPMPPGGGRGSWDEASLREVTTALRSALNGSGPAVLPLGADGALPPAARPEDPLTEAEDDPDDPTAVAVATSGSTGVAKLTLLPASALLASVSATHDRLGGPGRWLLALPAQHVAGVQVLLR